MADTNPNRTETERSTIPLPQSYLYALGNRLTSEQIDDFCTSSIRPSFFYGSLIFPNLISAVTQNADVDSIIRNLTPAILSGYQRYAIKWADFPAVLRSDQPTDAVEGMLMFGLNQTEKDRLHAYESGLYTVEVAIVRIELSDGSIVTIPADVYIWKGPRDDLFEVEDKVWSVERFWEGRSYYDCFR